MKNFTIFFIALLTLPYCILSSFDKNDTLNNLKKVALEIDQKLSDMGKKIYEKERCISCLNTQEFNFTKKCHSAREKKWFFFLIDRTEIASFDHEIDEFVQRLNDAVAQGDVETFFVSELFSDNGKNSYDMRIIKFYITRRYIEKSILIKLVAAYEDLFQKKLIVARQIELLEP